MRTLLLVSVVFLLAAAPAQARVRTVDRGIVLGVRPYAILLRELDGSRLEISVSPRTVVTVDGSPAGLKALQRGDVAYVTHFGNRPAVRIRAFSR